MIVYAITTESITPWTNMVNLIAKNHKLDSEIVPIRYIQEELKKFQAEYDIFLGEIIFKEEKNYTHWLLRYS